ncbi:type II toxin-antitoxin system VapC family toxin [Jatrophihabitans sp.]|uniref:type II toxin-antitoxin system VapC family toxin n=1 Tax=Jatrophihabitans sp. TaxID=1932789 RepID=UPI002C8E218C|nr:type II toxin-antitoxin system VapC family toxin [Jatrophihabitans sp.]
MFLLDTNVISELRKRHGNRGVKQWVAGQSVADLAISVVTVIEIEIGILRKERTDPDQARILTQWFEQNVLTGFADRILPLDLAAARRVASLHVPDQAPQHDALISGIALARGLTVVTRNIRDFERAGVECLNPWSDS